MKLNLMLLLCLGLIYNFGCLEDAYNNQNLQLTVADASLDGSVRAPDGTECQGMPKAYDKHITQTYDDFYFARVVNSINNVDEDGGIAADSGQLSSLEYTMSADIETVANYDEVKNIRISDVAELASLVVVAHKIMELENNDAVYDLLSRGNFVVLDNIDESEFNKINNEDLGLLEDYGLALLYIGPKNMPSCWKTPWSSIIQNQYFTSDDVSVIVHELVHVAAFATYGNPDANHENHLLWSRWSSDSIMARVIATYEFRYSPGSCDSDR